MSVLLAYALFILMLAIPFLVIGAIIAGFAWGLVLLVGGVIAARPAGIVTGIVLLAVTGTAAMTLYYWATTPPPGGDKRGIHAAIYQTYQGMKARQKAMQWLRDGTLQRLAEEQRARETKERAAGPTPRPDDSTANRSEP